MKPWWIAFVLLAVLSWGAYVPAVHHGQKELGANSALRAFLFIGMAYFLLAGVVLIGVRFFQMEPWSFTGAGMRLSFVGGVLGAIGALGIVFAFKYGGKPIVVAPLVFAGAPIMATLVTIVWDKPEGRIHPLFVLGICLAAVGAALVLRFKPAGAAHAPAPAQTVVNVSTPEIAGEHQAG